MKIAIIGHRPDKLDNDYELKSPLILGIKSRIEKIIYQCQGVGYLELISGMALGIDTLFAKIAVEHHIPFVAAVPFRGQEGRWTQKSKDEYYALLEEASHIMTIYPITRVRNSLKSFLQLSVRPFSAHAMQLKNEWMVDECDLLIAVWDGSPGDTFNCVQYANKRKNKEIIYIDPMKVRQELGIETI